MQINSSATALARSDMWEIPYSLSRAHLQLLTPFVILQDFTVFSVGRGWRLAACSLEAEGKVSICYPRGFAQLQAQN